MILSDAFKLAQMVKRHGIEAFQRQVTHVPGQGGYAVVVLDKVFCQSGSRSWTEERELALRTESEVFRYLESIG